MDQALSLDSNQVSSTAADIASGLLYLHNSQLGLHGNLNSQCCLVTPDWRIKLSGFGLARARASRRNLFGTTLKKMPVMWRETHFIDCL